MITTVTDKLGNKYHLSIARISRGVSFTLDGDDGRIGYEQRQPEDHNIGSHYCTI